MARSGGSSAGLTLGAAFAALLLFSGRARASSQFESDLSLIDYENPPEWELLPIPEFQIEGDESAARNVSAFLYMIRSAENRLVPDFERYFRMYGNARFFNTDDHPVLTGEKTGVPLPVRLCRAAGFAPGCVSTAAGAYQIIAPTWSRVRAAGAWGPRLPDFGMSSQDEAARRLLIESGALLAIEAGDISRAIAQTAPVWASLPGSRAGQGGVTLAAALRLFDDGLRFV
jgi:muramidase (phage lysozyme)